jgi:uncharacterized protein (TIGR03067 family)
MFLLLGVFCVLAGGVLAAADKRDDKKDLQGKWVLQKMEKDGKEQVIVAPNDPDYFDLSFDGDNLMVQFHSRHSERGTYTLDPGKTPRVIDIKPKTADEGKTIRGIYELTEKKVNKDTKLIELKLCVAEAGASKRPTEFKSVKDRVTVYHLLQLKQTKPASSAGKGK